MLERWSAAPLVWIMRLMGCMRQRMPGNQPAQDTGLTQEDCEMIDHLDAMRLEREAGQQAEKGNA